jgi:hypothetical protein
LFVEVLKLASTMGMLKMGTVALDGTKVHANASRHSALSYGHAKKIEKQLKREVKQLLRLAERADGVNVPDGMSIPEELERRELRLAAIAEAKAKIEARAEERLQRDQAEHESKLAARAEREKNTGKKPRGRPPEPPTGGVKEKDQVNLTDEDSRIMKVAGGGFDQCYNAQAAVATGSMLIVATEVTQATNDKEQLIPMIEKIQALPKELGRAKRILADSGYLSQSQRRAMRGGEDRAADRDGALSPSCQLEAALRRSAEIPARLGNRAGEDGVSAQDPARQEALRTAQTDPGTGVRHHQVRDGLSAMSAQRTRKRQRRMEFGHDELEHQANVRDAALLREHHEHSAQCIIGQHHHESTLNIRLFPFNQNRQSDRLD